VDSLTILVMGKGGVGKSSTINSIIGERAVSVNPFQVYAAFLVMGHLCGFCAVHFIFISTDFCVF
jgi:uncharacterized membrane protein